MKKKPILIPPILILLIILFGGCQGKELSSVVYVKSYEIYSPYVFLMKVNHFFSSDPGSLCMGFMVKDSDGKYLEDETLVDDIKIISPSGMIYQIGGQTPYAYDYGTLKGSGFEIYGSPEYIARLNQKQTRIWQYVNSNLHDAEAGDYIFRVRIKGREITARVTFEPFYFNGVRTDPLNDQYPSKTYNPNTITYDHASRIVEWDKVPNAENYRVYVFKSFLGSLKEWHKDLVENTLTMKINNIWNSKPGNPERIQYKIPDTTPLLPGQYYFFRIDAYIYRKSLLIVDTNYVNASRNNIQIPE